MRRRWLLALSITAIMLIVAVGCNVRKMEIQEDNKKITDNRNGTEVNKDMPVKIVYASSVLGSNPTVLKDVQDAINEITIPEINVEVELKLYSISSYAQQISMMMSSDEQLDIMGTVGLDISSCVTSGYFAELGELLKKYGQDIIKLVPENYLKAAQVNGKQYMVPCLQGVAKVKGIQMRADILKEAGYSVEDLNQMTDRVEGLTEIFAKVKEIHPEMDIFYPVVTSSINGPVWPHIDGLFTDNDFYDGGPAYKLGTIINDNTEIVNYYEQDCFYQSCKILHEWYQKGYIPRDAAIETDTLTKIYSAGNLFSAIFSDTVISDEAHYTAEMSEMQGFETIYFPLSKMVLNTDNFVSSMSAISATSQNKEAAMRFLNLLYTDAELINLLYWGIDGEQYTVNEDGLMLQTDKTAAYNTVYVFTITGHQF